MTELKTLKDFDFYHRICEDHYPFVEIELRQEAIKWYKSEEIGKENMFGDCGEELRGFLIHFFNLTEEDLK